MNSGLEFDLKKHENRLGCGLFHIDRVRDRGVHKSGTAQSDLYLRANLFSEKCGAVLAAPALTALVRYIPKA